ncbi:hypothetical protein D3C72_1155740 [compost metagenome]
MACLAIAGRQRQHTGGCSLDACLDGECHGGVLDQGRVHRVIQFAEFDDAGAMLRLQQSLGARATQGDTRLHQAPNVGRDGGLGLHVFHRCCQLRHILQVGVGAQCTRNVLVCRDGNTQCPKTVISGKQHHFQNRQAGRPVDMPDDALAPAVGAGIINRSRCAGRLACAEKLVGHNGQVFAERKVPPRRCVGEGGAIRHQL